MASTEQPKAENTLPIEASLSATTKTDPNMAQELKLKGNQAWKIGDITNALKYYTEAIQHDPKAPELYRNRAATHVSFQNYIEALKDAESAIALDMSAKSLYRKAEIRFHLCISQNGYRALEEAVVCFQRSFELEPVPEIKGTIEETEYYVMWLKANAGKLTRGSPFAAPFPSDRRELPLNPGQALNLGVLLSVCVDAAQKAGEIIRSVWKSGALDIKDKGNDDPFTKADVQSQQLIMGLLAKKWPSLKVVGEEDCQVPPTSEEPNTSLISLANVPAEFQNVDVADLCVFVDPLDATKEYTLGNLQGVMCLIGISHKGKAIAGVMYQPFVNDDRGNGTLMYGMKGFGVFGIKKVERNDLKVVLATTRTHSDQYVEAAIACIAPDEILRVGGAGYKALLVLQGKADVYLFPTKGTKKWDTCAPEAILREAGGICTDRHGNVISYLHDSDVHNSEGILISMKDHQKYVDALKSLDGK
eukprot:TRINITY_DN3998_c0_g1_i2.p1 TRINITY_DN3998_c0_g1~~TRINITY_DN3998_c0_g1_i2.p1  ORF type:complete len:475 (-),score=112.19 TRINITY_DN3998_c0_g1_i2:33-1457(-)